MGSFHIKPSGHPDLLRNRSAGTFVVVFLGCFKNTKEHSAFTYCSHLIRTTTVITATAVNVAAVVRIGSVLTTSVVSSLLVGSSDTCHFNSKVIGPRIYSPLGSAKVFWFVGVSFVGTACGIATNSNDWRSPAVPMVSTILRILFGVGPTAAAIACRISQVVLFSA